MEIPSTLSTAIQQRKESESLCRHLLNRVKSLSLRGSLRDPATRKWLVPLPGEMKRMMDAFLDKPQDVVDRRSQTTVGPLFSEQFQKNLDTFLQVF